MGGSVAHLYRKAIVNIKIIFGRKIIYVPLCRGPMSALVNHILAEHESFRD